MKSPGNTSFPARTAASAVAALVLAASGASAQTGLGIPVPHPLPGPTMQAENIVEEGIEAQDIRIFFHWFQVIDKECLGDGDILVTGPNGYERLGELVKIEEIPGGPFPLPLPLPLATDPASAGSVSPDGVIFPQPLPLVVATYRVFPPGEFWTGEHNGAYRVDLRENEVATVDGAFLPPKMLGAFHVAIGLEPEPVLPDETRITIQRKPFVDGTAANGVTALPSYCARVDLFFDDPNVKVDWGEVRREGNTFIAEIAAFKRILPGPIPGPWPIPLPMAGEEVSATAGDPSTIDSNRPVIFPIFSFTYPLGTPEPGEYRFVVRSLGELLGEEVFEVVPPDVDMRPPSARLEVRNIVEPGAEPHRMTVVYRDPSGVDLATIGDGDLVVESPCLFLGLGEPFPCWPAQSARLVEAVPLEDDLSAVKAVYEIDAPEGGWSVRQNGFYTVFLEFGTVCDALGNCVERRHLGGFEVAVDPGPHPPIPADVTLEVDASNPEAVIARVHIDFKGHFRVVEQAIVREGNRFVLRAFAEPLAVIAIFPPPPPPSQDLVYELGALEPGTYGAVFKMNGFPYEAVEFRVPDGPEPPIPAIVRLEVDPGNPEAVVARVRVQFRDHYAIVDQQVIRDGSDFCIALTVEGPLPILAPIPPPPVELEFPLGALDPGEYSASVKLNDFVYANRAFRVEDGAPPILADVALTVDTAGEAVKAQAVVDFEDPYVVLTNPGESVREGKIIRICATAERVTFIRPPDGLPFEVDYNLGPLEPGQYTLVYKINDTIETALPFVVREVPPPPLPHIAFIEIGQGDASHFAQVGVILPHPNLEVVDWGEVRREGNEFRVEITVDYTNPNPGPLPNGTFEPLPTGANGEIDSSAAGGSADEVTGGIGGFPVRLVTRDYVLGVLEPGEFAFIVESRGQDVAREGFLVRGMGPMAELSVADILEPGAEPHPFTINYHDASGLDHESIQAANVTVTGPNGFEALALLTGYASTDDVPSSGGSAFYAIEAPGGGWDAKDHGVYRVRINREAVRDLQGNILEEGRLGRFHVRIWPDPPPPPPGGAVEIDIRMGEGGWFADVELRSPPGVQLIVENWGELIRRGRAIVALAKVTTSDAIFAGPGEPQRHTYELGELRPGFHVFVFKSNLAHCGFARFVVPGVEGGGPFENWRDLVFGENVANSGEGDDGDKDLWSTLYEYAFGLNPHQADSSESKILRIADEEGRHYLGWRFRRLLTATDIRYVIEMSEDCHDWVDVTDTIKVMSRELDVDGTEEVVVCLREPFEVSKNRFLRVRVERLAGSGP